MTKYKITLQLGDFSSLSAVHYWNSQATQLRLAKWANEAVLDFEASFMNKEKLCPRAVLFERPRPFRTIQEQDWRSEPFKDEEILRLGGFQGELRTWHDMCFVNFNPKSICNLPEEFYSDDPSLNGFIQGNQMNEELFASAEDCIRLMAEDCDYLAEFEFFVDAASSFGGLTESLITRIIEDDYPKALRTIWASFSNCKDLAFVDNKPSHALIAMSLSKLSQVSTQLIPIHLKDTGGTHFIHEEELSLNQALNSSIVFGTAIDTMSTYGLTASSSHTSSALSSLKLATPLNQIFESTRFTDLALGSSKTVENWKSHRHVMRINHTEETFPTDLTSSSDLPIYAPNFAYVGYSQQATSSILLIDQADKDLASYLKSTLLTTKRSDFFEVEEPDAFTEVIQSLHSLVDNLDYYGDDQ